VAPSIVPVVHSDVAAALALSLALTAVNNIGLSAARGEAATERLHRAEARFRALVQNSSDVVTVLDADGRLTLVSPAVRHVTGWEVPEWLGTDRLRLVHPDDESRLRAALAVLAGAGDGEELRLEIRSRHRDGSWRWHEITMRGLLADPAVGGIVCNERDVSDRRSHQEQLAHAAAHDALTGLPNRTEMRRRLTDALPAAVPGHLVALLYIDLDGFKTVNDRHGHTTGDALLVATADRLREGLGPLDVLSRLGGDEFAAVLIDVPNTAAVEERVAELTAAMGRPFDLDGRSVTVGASIGWAATETATTDPQWLIEQADTAMYQVKREVSAVAASNAPV
jgi:diguanylate cyclase (GGDEF)-like protein/PAS domain S-box-containing protein